MCVSCYNVILHQSKSIKRVFDKTCSMIENMLVSGVIPLKCSTDLTRSSLLCWPNPSSPSLIDNARQVDSWKLATPRRHHCCPIWDKCSNPCHIPRLIVTSNHRQDNEHRVEKVEYHSHNQLEVRFGHRQTKFEVIFEIGQKVQTYIILAWVLHKLKLDRDDIEWGCGCEGIDVFVVLNLFFGSF